jgi:hypothetical protein
MTGEPNVRAEMRGPEPAELTSMADSRRVDCHTYPSSRPGDDLTRGFVAQDEWAVDAGVADGPIQVPMTV